MATLIESRPYGHTGGDAGGHFGRMIVTAFRHVLRLLSTFHRAMRERARLRRNMLRMRDLDDYILRDIGLERSQLAAAVRNCPPGRGGNHA
ncbi:MAG TPA: hypothetical protein VKN63_06320 [Afifellaceae bacterium]|nr:hypothetical protein [Afifellaceae bacterium]